MASFSFSGKSPPLSGQPEEGKQTIVCSICLQAFCQPKCLPCRHTFCLKCVRQLALPRQETALRHKERQPSKPTAASSKGFSPFACPTCRQHVTVPPGGVDEFQADFSMEAEVARQTLTAILCDTCKEQAEVGCQQCQKRLCSKCRHIHDQFAGADFHSLTALKQELLAKKKPSSSTRSRGRRAVACKTHARDVTLYCRQCDVAVCCECQTTSHRNHTTENLTARMEQMREEVRSLLQKAQNEVEIVDKVIKQKNQEAQELTRQEEEMVRQTVEAAGKVTAWANEAENNAVRQINAIAAPIKTELNQQKNAALERKTTLNQLRDRARLTASSGSFDEVNSLREDMEASLSVQACSVSSQPKAAGEPTNMLFRRCSSGKEILQNTVPRFVGEVTSFDEDTQLPSNSAWGFDYKAGGFSIFVLYTTVDGLTALSDYDDASSITVREFHPGYEKAEMRIGWEKQWMCCAASLPSSGILLITDRGQIHVGPDLNNLVPAPFLRLPSYSCLSHDSQPNGRKAHVCFEKNPGVYEIQELSFNPPDNVTTQPIFQIVCQKNGIMSFDVSLDATYFAVLNLISFTEHKTNCVQSQVSVFGRLKAEPCAVFRSPKQQSSSYSYTTILDRDMCYSYTTILDGDVCFSSYKGKEVLRVAVSQDDTVYILDFKNDCAIVGRTPLHQPMRVRTDAAGRVWVVCHDHVVAFNSTQ